MNRPYLLLTVVMLLCACGQTPPPVSVPDPTAVQAEPAVAAGTPEAAVFEFIAALNASNLAAAERAVVPAEMALFARVASATASTPTELWGSLIVHYIRDCAVAKIVFATPSVSGDSAEVGYRLELRGCIPVEQKISLVRLAGVWKIAKLSYPPSLTAAVSRSARQYAQNIYRAGQAFLAEDPTKTAADLLTADCTRGYVRGNYSVPDSKDLLAACRVEAVEPDGVRVTVQSVFGDSFTAP